jgi:hypothetical protein
MITNNVNSTALFDYLKSYSNIVSHTIVQKAAASVKSLWQKSIPLLVVIPHVQQTENIINHAISSVRSVQVGKINQAAIFAMASYITTYQMVHRMLIPQDILYSIQIDDF